MDRRGFLGSLMAVTTAVASGVKLPSGKEIAKATPKALSVQSDLLGLLKECNVISIASNAGVYGPATYEVEYLHCPSSKKNEYTHDIEKYTQGMRPVQIRFSHAAGELIRITVEWM